MKTKTTVTKTTEHTSIYLIFPQDLLDWAQNKTSLNDADIKLYKGYGSGFDIDPTDELSFFDNECPLILTVTLIEKTTDGDGD